MVLGAQALPPVVTVKNLKTKSGTAYKWTVSSRVSSPFTAPVYPGQEASAKVAVDVQRTTASKGYVITGKIVVTNPPQNAEALTVIAVKASFEPALPLLTPPPQQLDCPEQSLQPGESLSCSLKVELSSNLVNKLTPLVLVKDLPPLQAESLPLTWPTDEEQQLPGGKVEEPSASCALIQNQIVAGDLQSLVSAKTTAEQSDMLESGLEVCSESATLTYDITVVSQRWLL